MREMRKTDKKKMEVLKNQRGLWNGPRRQREVDELIQGSQWKLMKRNRWQVLG